MPSSPIRRGWASIVRTPIARPVEIADIFALKRNGGLLCGPRKLNVFNCLRAPNEASFAGGVFVLLACNDRPSWDLLAGKGTIAPHRTGQPPLTDRATSTLPLIALE